MTLSRPDPAWPSAAHYLIASRRAEVAALQQLRQLVQLSIVLGGLIHALQRERGTGSLYLGTGGKRFVELYQRMMAETEQQLGTFQLALNNPAATPALQQNSRALNDLAMILHQLDGRLALRQATLDLSIAPEQLHQFYTELISVLLSVIFSAADSASDPTVSRALTALFHFIQGKELAGQERALGSLVLARGRGTAEQADQIQLLVDGQQRSFEVFANLACDEAADRWQQLCRQPCVLSVSELRRELLASTGKAGDSARQADRQRCARWFDDNTQRIDAMQDIERLLEHHLDQTTAQRVTQLEHQLSDYQSNLGNANNAVQSRPAQQSAMPLEHMLQPPLLELLHDQQQRLHEMEEELQQVRSALDERKLIDRAKALLIRHRGMKEEQAYMLLRRTAMNQSRKLADVARAVIAMVDMLDDIPEDNSTQTTSE